MDNYYTELNVKYASLGPMRTQVRVPNANRVPKVNMWKVLPLTPQIVIRCVKYALLERTTHTQLEISRCMKVALNALQAFFWLIIGER